MKTHLNLPLLNKLKAALLFPVSTVALIAAAPESHGQLEEVVVTARKQSESLQSTPLSVSAVTERKIESSFLGDARGITQYAPNLVFDEIPTGTPGGGGISIRGISYQDVEKSFDPAVIMYVDNIPIGHNSGSTMDLLDISRIEVLRGPQGTLFGKNAVGGVVSIHRKKPIIGEWSGKIRSRLEDVGRENEPSIEGVLNVPIAEDMAAKINFSEVRKPGYYENITTGNQDGASKERRVGVHMLWEPTSDLLAEFQYQESRMSGLQTPTLQTSGQDTDFCTSFDACAKDNETPYSGDRRKSAGEVPPKFNYDTKTYQLEMNWQVNDYLAAVLVGAISEVEEQTMLDTDDVPSQIFTLRRSNNYRQDSIELRFDYDDFDRVKLTAGYFYWKADLTDWLREGVSNELFGLEPETCSFDGVLCSRSEAEYGSLSDSIFFEFDYRLLEGLYLIAGARYINETKQISLFSEQPVFNNVTLPLSKGERVDEDLISRFGFRYELSPETMVYGTYSTGFRSGGFSIRASHPDALKDGYAPETLTNYEMGFKSELYDRRFRINGAIFHMNYDDLQVELEISNPEGGTQSTVLNAAEATISGAELEVSALVNEWITVDFNAGYLNASYDEFVGKVFVEDDFESNNSSLKLRRAPDWNYTAALNFEHALADFDIYGRVSYTWTDSYETTVSNTPGTTVNAFGLLDVSLNFERGDWRFGMFGRNLTDEDEYSHNAAVSPRVDGGAFWKFSTPRPPRTFGIEVTYTFGDY